MPRLVPRSCGAAELARAVDEWKRICVSVPAVDTGPTRKSEPNLLLNSRLEGLAMGRR